ncbi:MAG: hypothetical protein EA392_01575 [Cryomorphaceae bacterium]|nr:MAG: hypothetical protein EA392_01575 [Cryomorphaceae bacterium]
MKFAAIDIGSNAIRLLLQEVFLENGRHYIEKTAYYRVPVRLGADTFTTGVISEEKQRQMIRTFQAFEHLLHVFPVQAYRVCATSALRESENATDVLIHIRNETGINIELISGEEEADLIFNTFKVQDIDHTGNYLFIDVGGGSTELTLIKAGQRIRSISLRIGTVRALQNKVSKKEWVQARSWIRELVKDEHQLVAIGTGGNINRIFKEADKENRRHITRAELQRYYEFIAGLSYVERITQLGFKPDRADVILPAAEIFSKIMDMAGISVMMVPKIGLSDGIVLQLFAEWKSRIRPSNA